MTRAHADLHVALYSGIYVRHDAVSNSLTCKLDVLDGLNRLGARVDTTVFAQASDFHAPFIRAAPNAATLFGHDEFWRADAHMFEFGMRYEIFDAVFVVPPGRPIMVTEHNTTPPELVDVPEVKRGCELSILQRHNLALAYRVACDSEFNVELDRSIGIPEDRLAVLHLPPAHVAASRRRSDFGSFDGPVRLLFLGRFVRAKGVADLLDAVGTLWAAGDDRFTLTLAGNPRFSDPLVMDQVERGLDRHGGAGRLSLVATPSDEHIAELLAESDVLVIPSYHEGYCVPVVEAYTAGCYVVGYGAGNLPNVVGGLGTLVPTGDVAGLTEALRDVVGRLSSAGVGVAPVRMPTASGDADFATWSAAVARHLEDYSASAYTRRFISLVADLAEASPAGLSGNLRTAMDARLDELSGASEVTP